MILAPAQDIPTAVGAGPKEAGGADDSRGVSLAQGEGVKRWRETRRMGLLIPASLSVGKSHLQDVSMGSMAPSGCWEDGVMGDAGGCMHVSDQGTPSGGAFLLLRNRVASFAASHAQFPKSYFTHACFHRGTS